ncbi:MAG: hypothetical protein HN348_12770 [Proteobacteria bacterium]|nr:hypothetical protein [Pseudomonadota bacterium]
MKIGRSCSSFFILGHELIHAKHAAEGTYTKNDTATERGYKNLEEQRTIATGKINENQLRREHNQGQRSGHSGRDTRFPRRPARS